MESQADSGTKSSHPEVDGAVEAESGDGHSRTVECPIFEPMVYHTEEKRNVALHSRPAAGQQSDHSERRNRTDHRRVRGGLRQKVDLLGDLYSGYDQF